MGSTLKPLHGLRIVVAEDEAIIALELELILDELGAEVVAIAGTGEEAVDLVGQYLPDIVTMDIRLAGAIDGIAAATEILRHHRIRSLFVTAYSEPSIVERAQAARPIGWVQKPFRGHTILAALAPFLGTRG